MLGSFFRILLLIYFLGISFNFSRAEAYPTYNPDYTILAINYLPDYSLLNKEALALALNISQSVIPVKTGISVESNQVPEYEIENLIEEEYEPLVSRASSVEIPDPFAALTPSTEPLNEEVVAESNTPPDTNQEILAPPSNATNPLLIYRFLFDAVGSDDGKEFIELYNESDLSINLADYSIQTFTLKKNFETGMTVAPHSSFFILLGNAVTGSSNQMLWKSGSLKNSTDMIYLTNSHIKVLDITDSTILDSTIYNSTDFSNFTAGKIYQRKLKDEGDCPADLATNSLIYCRGHAASAFKLVDF